MLQCPFNKTHVLQNRLDVFNISATYPYLLTNAIIKTDMQHTLWNNAARFCRKNIPETYEVFLQKECTCLTFLSKEQYPFGKGNLSAQDAVLLT
jgi:hypothetical protein